MECILVNLDSQPERYRKVEENFRQHRTARWRLSRLKAVDLNDVARSSVEGKISPPEKGCFLSHLVAINLAKNYPGHTMIVEDDVLFAAGTFETIDKALGAAAGSEWDLMFTDVCVPDILSMLALYQLQKKCSPDRTLQLIPLDKVVFAGSTAYIVNEKSKSKVLSLLTEAQSLDLPYDLTLRRFAYEKRLTGFVIFPFPTSLSSFADTSQIQKDGSTEVADIAWNAFRRLIWMNGSVEAASEKLDTIEESYFDPRSKVFSKIIGCMLSSNYKSK